MKKTLLIYGVYAVFAALLVGMGLEMGVNQREFAIYILPILLILALLPMAVDVVGSLCLVIAWLPFSRGVAQFELGVITLNPYIVGMTVFAIIIVVQSIFKKNSYSVSKTDFYIFLITVIYFISTVFSDDVIESGYLAFHAIFVPVVTYVACKGFIRTKGDSEKATNFLIVSIAVFSCMAVAQFAVTDQRVAMLGMPFIGVSTLCTIGLLLLMGVKRWKSPMWAAIAVVILLGLIVTFSRMYLVILLFAPWIYSWIKKGKSSRLISSIFLVTLIGTVVISINPEPFKPDRFDRSLERSFERITSLDFWKGSIYGRAYSYHAGLERFVESPLIGHGLKKGKNNITTHNFHVEWLEYSGLLGYILWVLLFYNHFRMMEGVAREDNYIAANLLGVVVILINSVTNGFMHGVMPTVAFMLIGFNEARFRILKISSRGGSASELKNLRRKVVTK